MEYRKVDDGLRFIYVTMSIPHCKGSDSYNIFMSRVCVHVQLCTVMKEMSFIEQQESGTALLPPESISYGCRGCSDMLLLSHNPQPR